MTQKLLLRIAAGLTLFFALGHTMGHFTRHDTPDPKAREILQLMADNKFDMFGQMRSFDESYTGMSLNLIFVLLSFTAILLILSNYTKENSSLVKALIIPIMLCLISFTITGFLFFFPLPAITCLLASVALAICYFR